MDVAVGVALFAAGLALVWPLPLESPGDESALPKIAPLLLKRRTR